MSTPRVTQAFPPPPPPPPPPEPKDSGRYSIISKHRGRY